MVNHPNRSRQSVDAELRRLLSHHPIQKIEITILSDGVIARAMPMSFHPAVSARRGEAIAALEGQASLADVERIQQAAMSSVAMGRGRLIEDAVSALKADLGQQKAAEPA